MWYTVGVYTVYSFSFRKGNEMLCITKAIRYDPQTRDFLLELDGEPVGYAATKAQAELILDQLVFERLRRFVMPVEGEGDAERED